MNAPVDVTAVRIETERLILRAWREPDLADFYEYASVEGVGEMAGWSHHQSVEESRRILDSFISGKKTFALEWKENGKVIGSLGLEPRDADAGLPEELQGREIGYVLSRDYWGRGLMPEAVKAVTDYCFQELSFDYLTCGHFDYNDRSRRVVEKSGFRLLKRVVTSTARDVDEPGKLYVLYNPRKVTAPFDAAAIRLETERLILRPMEPRDLTDLHEIASDPEIADMGGGACCKTEAETKMLLEKLIQNNETLGLELKSTGKLVGTFSVQARPWETYPFDFSLRGREFGFDLNRNDWGQGLMPEAVRAMTDYCLNSLGYDFVTCDHFLRNDRSSHAIQKCGFSYLFNMEQTMTTGVTEKIRCYIIYKEKQPCLN